MVKTAIVHQQGDVTLEELREIVARTTMSATTMAPFQLPQWDGSDARDLPQGDVVSAVHVATDPPICFRLPEPGEIRAFREACQSLQRYSPKEWATLVESSGCVFVESGRATSVHSRSQDMTVYSIPLLQLTKPAVRQAIWRVAEALDALVLGEDGQLIWRPGESGWSEPSLHGGRKLIPTQGD